jgi:hypothetical protein
MAFTIGAWAKAHNTPFLVGLGGGGSTQPPTQSYHYELADQTVTTPIPGQCPTGISWGRAVICQKTFTAGTGTVPPVYELQVAADAAFTTSVRSIGFKAGLRTTDNQTLILEGPVPDVQTNPYVRVKVTPNGTDTVVYDALIDLLPGV